jgi:hypothetical protein
MDIMRLKGGILETGLNKFVDILSDNCIIAEIGSYAGESAALFLRRAKKLYCIDPWAGTSESIHNEKFVAEAEEQFDRLLFEHPDRIVKVRMTSTCAALLFPEKFFDVVYIDGLHDYNHVRIDILTWLPKLKTSGILSGHDWGNNTAVAQALRNILGEPDKIFQDSSWMKVMHNTVCIDTRAANFDEEFYLKSHPDIAKAVADKLFTTGYEHFARFGLAESREHRWFS